MENFEDYKKIVEDGLKVLGVDLENAKGEEIGQWLIFNQQTEIYIDLWEQTQTNGWNYFQPEGYNLHIFQVLSPICKMPDTQSLIEFYEDLLQNNLNLLFASYTINKEENILAVKYRRICNELKLEDVVEAIECVGYYSEMTMEVMSQKYGLEKIIYNPQNQ
jgi:hypothetical protein